MVLIEMTTRNTPLFLCSIVLSLSPFALRAEDGVTSLYDLPDPALTSMWKKARVATPSAERIEVAQGFEVEMLASSNYISRDGSWISLEFDDKGNVYIGREDKGIWRFSLNEKGELVDPRMVDEQVVQPSGMLWAYDSLYVNSNRPADEYRDLEAGVGGLYRLQDKDGDGLFETRDLLLQANQSRGPHGRNHLKLGPDGMIYFLSGEDVDLPESAAANSPYRNYREDQLLSRAKDQGTSAPGGHLIRMDEKGSFFQLVAGGFRNAVDLAFDAQGEMFTVDAAADTEATMSWYRPSRLLHVANGGEYGWRSDGREWPSYYEDSLPAVTHIGLASPTGVEFAHESTFPAPWRNRLLVGDWTYGRILAIDLSTGGNGYEGSVEVLAEGQLMNVTDLAFGPDSNLYFTTGGQGTKPGLYRIKWQGVAPRKADADEQAQQGKSQVEMLRELRSQLEFFQVSSSEQGAKLALHYINHPDRLVRYAARVALENQPAEMWVEQALESSAPAAMIALARTESVERGALLKRMNQLKFNKLGEEELVGILRAYELEFARHGMPDPRERAETVEKLGKLFPHETSTELNQLLAELLIYLGAPDIMEPLLELAASSATTQELSHYLMLAAHSERGWSLESKRSYLKAVRRLEVYPGGHTHLAYVKELRDRVVDQLSAPEKLALSSWTQPMVTALPDSVLLADAGDQSAEVASASAAAPPAVSIDPTADGTASVAAVAASPSLPVAPAMDPTAGDTVAAVEAADASPEATAEPVATEPPALAASAAMDPTAEAISGVGPQDAPPAAPELGTISIAIEPHLFPKKSAINNGDRERFYQDILAVLNTYPKAKFQLIGHADDTQWAQTNYDIGMNRARFTANYLISRGIPKESLTWTSVGDQQPSTLSPRRLDVLVHLNAELE